MPLSQFLDTLKLQLTIYRTYHFYSHDINLTVTILSIPRVISQLVALHSLLSSLPCLQIYSF